MALIGEMKYLTIGGNTYSIPEPDLPIASSSTLGGIKVGSGLTIDSSTGVLTATGTSITIDTAMSDSSTNTVQNKVIKSYVDTNIPTKVSDLQNDSGFTTNTGTVTSVGAQNATNGGLTISGSPVTSSGSITVGHTNVLTSAQTTQAVYPIKIDKNGHISAYGNAVSIPTKTSDLTNDSGFITDAGVTSFNGDTGAITYTAPVTSVNGNTGAVTVVEDDHKWGGVTLGGTGANTAANSYVPAKDSVGNTSGTASWATVTSTPTNYCIAKYDNGPYLYSTTPTSSDSSTKVATTAWVTGKGYLTSYTETDPTVPSWAKAESKPSYTASEVGAIPQTAGDSHVFHISNIQGTGLLLYKDSIKFQTNVGSSYPYVGISRGNTTQLNLITSESGQVILNNVATPTSNYHAANKLYVDNKISNITFPVTSVNTKTGAITLNASDVGAVATSAVGAASGVAPLNASSKIDSTYLPSYVDDIIEGYYYNSKFWEEAAHTTEITGEAGKIYVDLSTNKTYRYSGTGYVEVSSGSLVTITRNLTSGTKSATINVDGTDYDIYSTDDTKNTAGSTDDTTNSLYIIGATSQGANPQTYSNKNFHIRGSYLYLGYNGTTTVTGLCFYYGSYYATMVYGGAVTGDTYTPILKFSSATPANGVILRNIANPRNDEDAVNRGYLISALSNKVSDYSFKTEDNYKQVINLENYSGGFNISSTVYPDEEGTTVNATRWLNARFYDGALAIKAVDYAENNTSFNGYLAINKDEVNLGKINNNVVTSYIKIDNNGTTIKNVVTPTDNTDAANKQYVDNKFSSITFPVTSVNGQTGAVTVTDQNVTQTAIQTNAGAEYRLLLSNSTNDTTETSGVFKAGKLTYDPFYNRLILYPGTSSSGKLRMYYRDGFYFNLEPGGYLGNSSNYKAIVTFSGGNGQDVILRGISTPSSNNDATNKLYVDNVVTTQASIGSDGLITYKNSGNTSLYTVQLPLFDGGTGSSSSLYLPLTGGSLSGNLSIGGTTTSTGLITGSGGISTTVLTTSSNTTIGGNLSVSGTTTSTGLLTASGGISTTTLTTSGNAVVGGTLGVTGATTLNSTLGVTGAATLNSTLNVTGNTTVGGNLIIGGDIRDSNGAEVAIYNNAHMLGHAQVEGNTQLYGTLQAAGATTLGSTLDVTGDTTVNGVLDVKKFRCLKLLSAAGWYRVLTATPLSAASGAIVKFKIIQYGDGNTSSVNHEVTLSFNKSGINFRDESSDGAQYVTKIRVNQLSSGYAVDIYYSDTTGRTIDVFFEPYIYAPWRNRFSANSLESVADSPADETVKTVYDFHNSGAYFNNLSVDGVLSVTNRRSAMLSDVAAGWHRVLEFAPTTVAYRLGRAGIIIDFDITRYGTTNETHHVSLSLIETNAKFYGEFSNSNTRLIDKIRYTYDSSKGYVDIHLSSAYSANVAVDYQVAASAGSFRGLINTKSLAVVADSPSGETVLSEYAFSANGTGDLNVNGIVTGQGFADLLFGLGTSIPSSTNCNSLTSEGKYTCYSSAIAGTLTNSPYTDAFGMLVIRVAESQRLVQVAMPNSTTITVKLRHYNGTSWTAWKTLTPS